MSGYTKGPWRLYPAVFREQMSRTIQSGNGRVNLGKVFTNQSSEGEGLANAHLMAAAPELLEALTALRSFMWAEGYADQTPAMAQADAAIAKAEAL